MSMRRAGCRLVQRALCLGRATGEADTQAATSAWQGVTPGPSFLTASLTSGPHLAACAFPRGADISPDAGHVPCGRQGGEIGPDSRHWRGTASSLPGDRHCHQAPSSLCLAPLFPRTAAPTPSSSYSPRRLKSTSAETASQRPSTWADRHCPASMLPYVKLMRADAPIGTYLLALPCVWSIGLAASPGSLPDLNIMALFSAGAFLLRSAGCTINDLWDRELDAKVERTKSRPLASGAITPTAAVGALGVQLLLGLGILLQLNDYSKVLGASSLALVGAYPLMKRVTYWPQAFLGLTINWGTMLGYAAVQGHCDWPVVLPLYAAGVAWTLVYDTIYAHQDKADDVSAGVKSTALLFADNTKLWLSGFAALSTTSLLACGAAAGAGVVYYGSVGGVAAHYVWQIKTVDLNNGADCAAKFVSNKWLGAMLGTGIVADRLAAMPPLL